MASGTVNPEIRYCSQCGQPNQLDQLARFGDTLICPNCKFSYLQKLREGVAPMQPVFVYAGFWIRFVAALIDGIILGVAASTIQFLISGRFMGPMAQIRPGATPEEAMAYLGPIMGMAALGLIVNLIIGSCYEGFFLSRVGATPGKMALGLKVVRPDGGPLTLGRAIGRHCAKWLSSLTLLIGYIIAGFDSQKRAMHDMIADTRVIKADTAAVAPYSLQA